MSSVALNLDLLLSYWKTTVKKKCSAELLSFYSFHVVLEKYEAQNSAKKTFSAGLDVLCWPDT